MKRRLEFRFSFSSCGHKSENVVEKLHNFWIFETFLVLLDHIEIDF